MRAALATKLDLAASGSKRSEPADLLHLLLAPKAPATAPSVKLALNLPATERGGTLAVPLSVASDSGVGPWKVPLNAPAAQPPGCPNRPGSLTLSTRPQGPAGIGWYGLRGDGRESYGAQTRMAVSTRAGDRTWRAGARHGVRRWSDWMDFSVSLRRVGAPISHWLCQSAPRWRLPCASDSSPGCSWRSPSRSARTSSGRSWFPHGPRRDRNPRRILCAYDATPGGDDAAERLFRRGNRVVRVHPALDGDDWNDMLRRDLEGNMLETDDRLIDRKRQVPAAKRPKLLSHHTDHNDPNQKPDHDTSASGPIPIDASRRQNC